MEAHFIAVCIIVRSCTGLGSLWRWSRWKVSGYGWCDAWDMCVKSILIKQINTKHEGDWWVSVILGVGHIKQSCSCNVRYRATHSFPILLPPQALLGRKKTDQLRRKPLFVFLFTCTSLVCLWHLAHCSLSSFHNLASCGVKSLADLGLSGLVLPHAVVGRHPCSRDEFKAVLPPRQQMPRQVALAN